MGDRANVYVINRRGDKSSGVKISSGVYLYTHWGGSDLPLVVQNALASRAGLNRQSDEAYLTRIIYDFMIGDDQYGETGYGISTFIQDNEHKIIVVDCESLRINFVEEGSEVFGVRREQGWSFGEYIGLSEKELRSFWRK